MDSLATLGFAAFSLVLGAVCIVAFLQSLVGKPLQRQERRLKTVQRKLDLVMDRLGVEEPPPPGVAEALQQGKRMRAIAAYRKATGADLTEARDAVDAMASKGGG